MIYKALKFIRQELEDYLAPGAPSEVVRLDNISQAESSANATAGQGMANKVVMTLINLSEETALKNMPHLRTNVQGQVQVQNPPISLYLHVLFVANSTDYGDALARLSGIVKFFQGKRYFTPDNSPANAHEMGGANFSLTADLMSPSVDELNNLWGMLGGKQMPAAFYRFRLVEVDRANVLQVPVPTVVTTEVQAPVISAGPPQPPPPVQ